MYLVQPYNASFPEFWRKGTMYSFSLRKETLKYRDETQICKYE